MSKLISGWEAIKAVESGECVEYKKLSSKWYSLNDEPGKWVITDFTNGSYKFRLKPRTITINGIEVPAPIKGRPVDGEIYFILSGTNTGYTSSAYTVPSLDGQYIDLYGYWENEEEIKQVVAALRKVFRVQP